jgi:hypothetical protein
MLPVTSGGTFNRASAVSSTIEKITGTPGHSAADRNAYSNGTEPIAMMTPSDLSEYFDRK